MFFVNRVRTEHKGKDLHSDWTKAWIELFNALQKYVKQVHTTGLVWNSSPVSHSAKASLLFRCSGSYATVRH